MTQKLNKYMDSLEVKKRSLERTKPTVIEVNVSPNNDRITRGASRLNGN